MEREQVNNIFTQEILFSYECVLSYQHAHLGELCDITDIFLLYYI